MHCPLCKIKLEKVVLSGVEVDYCPKCLGTFFEEEELRWAKDEKDRNLRWLDIDLWKDQEKFKIAPLQKLCPWCRLPLYETNYGDSPVRQAQGDAERIEASDIKVDVCNICHGIWLDRGEFKKIIQYLKKKADQEILSHYLKNLREEFWEIFAGPETLKEEIDDFLTILKLLNYKFAVQHPNITKIISNLPR